MADKKEYSYLNSFLPSAERRYSILRWGWGEINRTDTIDSGQISDCDGVEIDPPNITVSHKFTSYAHYAEPIGIFGFDDFLVVIYRDSGKIKLDWRFRNDIRTGVIGDAKNDTLDLRKRSVVQFNVAKNTENIVASTFERKLLIFPDCMSMDFRPAANNPISSLGSTYPKLHLASVYGSRVFGVDSNLVYASAYNDYANWDLDTADDTSSAHAWVSMSQSNVKADGEFTGICTYDNHMVLFKKDFMQLVYNNKNPFRIVDVGAYGADNPYAIAEANGVLYFASADGVYAFGGGTPKLVSTSLGLQNYAGAVLGGYKDTLYAQIGSTLYRLRNGTWSGSAPAHNVKQFAANDNGLYGLLDNGDIVMIRSADADKIDTDSSDTTFNPDDYGDWWFETDLMFGGRLDIRRAKKITLLGEIWHGSSVSAYLLKDGEKFNAATSKKVLESNRSGLQEMRGMLRGFGAFCHRLRICGHGKAIIHAAELMISYGGDVYKDS